LYALAFDAPEVDVFVIVTMMGAGVADSVETLSIFLQRLVNDSMIHKREQGAVERSSVKF